jgi:hypothetical protein
MNQVKPALVLAMALGPWRVSGTAQPIVSTPGPDTLLSTSFATGLTYEAALSRLGTYYEEQVGRKLAEALPEIAPHRHFEVWHDMWVFFDTADGKPVVTIKRLTEGINTRLVKSWMLDLAGRLEAVMPLEFKEEPPLGEAEGDVCASRNDLARALDPDSSMKAIDTWEHAGLIVSASPLTWVVMAPTGLHGVHHVSVAAEGAAGAKQLLAKLTRASTKPGICAVYSEEVELDQEVRDLAGGKSAAASANLSQAMSIPNMDEKYLENRVRAEPEIVKRAAAAQGQYAIRFRLDKSYRKVTVSWMILAGYARGTGKFETERALGQSAVANPKPGPQAGSPLTARTKLAELQPGAYRVRLEGEDAAGQAGRIDERTYWFDGKTFEEL